MSTETQNQALRDALQIRINNRAITPPDHLAELIRSSDANSLLIIKDAGEEPFAYVTYANVEKHSIINLVINKEFPRYRYEFSEGGLILIYHIFSAPGRKIALFRALRKLSKTFRCISYAKADSPKVLIRKKNKYHKKIYAAKRNVEI